MKKQVVISIVTYNSRHIFEVLDSLKKELANKPNYRVVIFDNHSDSDFQSKLKKYEDSATIHFNDENKGFGYGHNVNLMNAPEDYYLVFNPDILFKEEEIVKLVQLMEEMPQAGICVPKVLNDDGTTQYIVRQRFTLFDYLLRFVPFNFIKKLFDKRLRSYECRDLSETEITKVKSGSGCFMLIRGSLYNKIGGFDERYFMYFEDNDICLETWKNGYEVIYTPFAEVTHFYEKGAHKSKKLFSIFMKSMRQFFNKWGWKFF